MLSERNVPIFILNLIYKLCWVIVQRASMFKENEMELGTSTGCPVAQLTR